MSWCVMAMCRTPEESYAWGRYGEPLTEEEEAALEHRLHWYEMTGQEDLWHAMRDAVIEVYREKKGYKVD